MLISSEFLNQVGHGLGQFVGKSTPDFRLDHFGEVVGIGGKIGNRARWR
jgi:hypothetical protein